MKSQKEGTIKYIVGDATEPIQQPAIIAHVVNDQGGWGKGFVKALSEKWIAPEAAYRLWFQSVHFTTGKVQFVPVGEDEDETYVANMVAQCGYRSRTNPIPLDYLHLETCLKEVNTQAKNINASVHMPRIGTGLAGGDWNRVSQLLEEIMEVETYVYDLPHEEE